MRKAIGCFFVLGVCVSCCMLAGRSVVESERVNFDAVEHLEMRNVKNTVWTIDGEVLNSGPVAVYNVQVSFPRLDGAIETRCSTDCIEPGAVWKFSAAAFPGEYRPWKLRGSLNSGQR